MPPLGPWLEAHVLSDQQAFTQLVGNTTPLVMAAALRRCGGWHALAQEAAQVVYLDLARRAPSPRADASLTGWLHQRATRAAGDLMKQELRRMVREQQAVPPLLPTVFPTLETGRTAARNENGNAGTE